MTGPAIPPTDAAAATVSPGTERDPADAADRMFGSTESLLTDYGPALTDSLNRITDATGMTPEARQAHLVEVTHAFADARIPSRDAAGIHAMIAQHITEPADDATLEKWTSETRRLVRDRYGDDGPRRMKVAEDFVKARPELLKVLATTGLGSHPDIVLRLVDRADHIRVKPRTRKDG